MYNKNVFLIFFIFIFVLIITCTGYIDNFSINYAPPSKFNKLDRDYNNELLQYYINLDKNNNKFKNLNIDIIDNNNQYNKYNHLM